MMVLEVIRLMLCEEVRTKRKRNVRKVGIVFMIKYYIS